jgi:bifunctional UDP-N-acetylglucosamine pyrophosphorylase/glucosamine-1-phosphate N-acetyltransferase
VTLPESDKLRAMTAPVAIVLAAGQGKRMKSDLPKVLHPACGRPIVEYVLDAARAAGVTRLVVVVGHRAELVREALGQHADVEFATQTRQLGTGDAVRSAREAVGRHAGPVLVLAGDTPLLRSASLRELLDEQRTQGAACVVGTAETEQNQGLGRIVRDDRGEFLRIVEERDATPEQKLIREVNTGCYAFREPAGGVLSDRLCRHPPPRRKDRRGRLLLRDRRGARRQYAGATGGGRARDAARTVARFFKPCDLLACTTDLHGLEIRATIVS